MGAAPTHSSTDTDKSGPEAPCRRTRRARRATSLGPSDFPSVSDTLHLAPPTPSRTTQGDKGRGKGGGGRGSKRGFQKFCDICPHVDCYQLGCRSYFFCHLYFPDHRGLSFPVILYFPVLTFAVITAGQKCKSAKIVRRSSVLCAIISFVGGSIFHGLKYGFLKRKSKTYDPE